MKPSQLVVEAPALRRTIVQLIGEQAVPILAHDYERVAALGGNREVGIVREEGVSYNPRIARIAMIALEDGKILDVSGMRIAIWSTLSDVAALSELEDAEIRGRVAEALSGVKTLDSTVQTIRSAVMLDTIRHLHMTTFGWEEKRAYLSSGAISDVACGSIMIPSKLKLKLENALSMQRRLLETYHTQASDE